MVKISKESSFVPGPIYIPQGSEVNQGRGLDGDFYIVEAKIGLMGITIAKHGDDVLEVMIPAINPDERYFLPLPVAKPKGKKK